MDRVGLATMLFPGTWLRALTLAARATSRRQKPEGDRGDVLMVVGMAVAVLAGSVEAGPPTALAQSATPMRVARYYMPPL